MFEQFYNDFSLDGEEVSLEQLLEARENRVQLQQQCLAQYGQTVLSLTLLAVGGVKKNALLDYVFASALENLTACFSALGVKPTAEFIRPLNTGHEALFVLPIEADKLKRAMIALEESSPLARLWDIDVIQADGRLLSRTEFNYPPRPCLVCQDEAKVCARARKHSFEAIWSEMKKRVQADDFSQRIATMVYQALVDEARLSPKPGLVDSINNGSHQDMNLKTFEQSALALRPFFAQFVLKGIETVNLPHSQILAQIRPLGVIAEKAMRQATNDVNTHKGAIFAFGLICTAIGRLYALDVIENQLKQSQSLVNAICEQVAQFTQGLTEELKHYPDHQPLTAGVRLFREYGLTGARGEAESGFLLVRQALDFVEAYKNVELQHQWLIILLYLMANNPDTNVVNRGKMEGLTFIQQEANKRLKNKILLQNKNDLIASLTEFDQACIARNLSSGGSADLLALTIFFKCYLKS